MNVYGRNYKYDYKVLTTSDIPYQHTLINGAPCPSIVNPEKVAALQDFQFEDNDIVVASYQKGGSIILRVMIQMLLGLPVMEDHFHWLELDGNVVDANVKGFRLLRTHLPFSWLPHTHKKVKFFFLYPLDEEFLISLYSHFLTSPAIRFTGSWDTFFRLWKSEKVFYGSFYKHMLSWTSAAENNNNMMIWPLLRDQISREKVEEVARRLFDEGADNTCSNAATCTDDTIEFGDTAKIYDFLVQNNPATKWRTEKEQVLLQGGLSVLPEQQQQSLLEERREYGMGNRDS